MKKNIRLIISLFLVLLLAVFPSGCKKEDSPEISNLPEYVTDKDFETSFNKDDANLISYGNDYIQVMGYGAEPEGPTVTINEAGIYVVYDAIDNGQLIVDAPEDAEIHLVLSGLSLSCSDDPAIFIKQAGKVILTLTEETENFLSGGENVSSETGSAAIFSACDLTINGEGSLNITGSFDNAISSDGNLIITGGKLNLSSKESVFAGNTINVLGGTILGASESKEDLALADAGNQNSILFKLKSAVPEGETLAVTDKDGNIVLGSTLKKECSSIFISINTLKEGETYSLLAGETLESESAGGLLESGTYTGETISETTVNGLLTISE